LGHDFGGNGRFQKTTKIPEDDEDDEVRRFQKTTTIPEDDEDDDDSRR
jgi:hypothetical protein